MSDKPGTSAADESSFSDEPFGQKFYHGTILRVQYGRGSGILRTGSGREVRFAAPTVEYLDGRRIEDLTEGMVVGFDVGWTSHGLRVTKIKIF